MLNFSVVLYTWEIINESMFSLTASRRIYGFGFDSTGGRLNKHTMHAAMFTALSDLV